jgi:hypothetical protein
LLVERSKPPWNREIQVFLSCGSSCSEILKE